MIYIVLLIISFFITLWLGIFSWKRRHIPGVTAFSLIAFLGAGWLAVITLMLISSTKDIALFWYRTGFVGISAISVLLFVFVMQYSESRIVTTRRLVLLFIIPVITQITVWTDDRFHLFLKEIAIVNKNGLMVIQSWSPGYWFVVHSVYSFALMLVALVWLFVYAVRQYREFRGQSIGFILGTLMVILPNLAFALGMIPPDIIILPFAFLLMNICFAWAIFRYKLFEVVPVARNKLVDIMTDGMIVLDMDNRIVDMNPAARERLLPDGGDVAGKSARQIFAPWPSLIERFFEASHAKTEISLPTENGEVYYDVRITPLADARARPAGRLILFRDITDRITIEKEKDRLLADLNDKNRELERLYGLALDANPMTGLPGNNSVTAAITKAMEKGESICVIFSDLDNFKAFNDKYGFAHGDDVIRFTADVLRRSLEAAHCPDAFVGHVGGDDFVLLPPSDKTKDVVEFIIREFDSGIIDFYSDEDLAQGFISSTNRQGQKEDFPIMTISLAGVDLSHNQYQEYIAVNDACAELKKKSKSIPGSSFCLDLRRTA